ncbi:MAG TPA: methionyl-tRNA formyltransferase [Bauldia sp.]|nr:methionyl-tRNA formyltransferase [Bauldia sp.]
MPLRVVFFGTPPFSVPTLTEIVGQGHEVVAVYSQPPRPAGRGMAQRMSPVHETAERFGLRVLTPRTLRTEEEAARFAELLPDVAVVVAYGLILPRPFLEAPRQGCLNLHASLLPRWRGAAPIARAIMAGDAETGVMVMRMEEGLDTGPVAMAERVAIGPDVTAGELTERLSQLGADLMARALAALSRDGLSFTPQAAEGVTYAKKIDKGETRVDWARPAREVHNHIRGLSPEPGAWFEADFGKGPERIRALRSTLGQGSGPPGAIIAPDLTVACGSGAVRLTEVQRAGKQPMKTEAFLAGIRQLPRTFA